MLRSKIFLLTEKQDSIVYGVVSVNLGDAIKNSGLMNNQNFRIFICNKATNNPLGNGILFCVYSGLYWNKHAAFIHVTGNTIKAGTLNLSDLTAIKIDN